MRNLKLFFKKFRKNFNKVYGTRLGKFSILFGTAFLATLIVCVGVIMGIYSYVFSGMETEQSLTKEEAGVQNQDFHTNTITNIALFGIDTTDSSMQGRSDSIIIVSLDHKNKEIRLSAIQRDTYVTIEGRGQDKINHAYAFGGPELAVKTLNQNFNTDIVNYAAVNFSNMEKIVDTLGGIEMEVTEVYRKQANKHIQELASKRGIAPKLIQSTGKQTLSGMQVLGMSRARYNVGGTSARSEMHEIILSACFNKLKTKNVLEYPEIAKQLLSLVKTTLNSTDVVNIAMKVVLDGYAIRQEVFPLEIDQKNGGGGQMINGVWYLTYNQKTGNQHIQDFIYKGILPAEK